MINVKKATSGLDMNTNNKNSQHYSLVGFFMMKQGEHESNDKYKEHFDSVYDTLLLVGGKNAHQVNP